MAGLLSPYRVLDLSDERGLLAGHMLAKLGADVVQVEPCDGSAAREVGPVASDAPAGDNSFYWSAYAAGKRGLACDLTSEAGRELLHRLIKRADFLIETADPDTRQALGVSVEETRAVNPALIHVSITAFGSNGPKANYAASDLVVWAAGGPLLPSRDGERPPVRITVPQSFLHAAADAAGGALIAHFARLQTGRGQHVDVSAQQSVALCTLSSSLAASFGHANFSVMGAAAVPRKKGKNAPDRSGKVGDTIRSKWQVRDGLVEMYIGPLSGRFADNLFKWLHSEGACDDDIATWDWGTLPQRILGGEISEEDLERAYNSVAKYFTKFTKEELLEKAMEHRFLCAPIATTRDLLESRQLKSRRFFETVEEASGTRRTLPGAFTVGVPGADVPLTPAPALGQHTTEVLRDWLALEDAEIGQLRAQGAIA